MKGDVTCPLFRDGDGWWPVTVRHGGKTYEFATRGTRADAMRHGRAQLKELAWQAELDRACDEAMRNARAVVKTTLADIVQPFSADLGGGQ